MANKKKGDLLETMVYVLEKSLIDNEDTTIFTNKKIKDRDGVDREFDIYVETNVNNKQLSYAFECKNYKKGIEIKHIVDFYSRIESLGAKGYFVTSSNYQKGAISKAKALGIDLLCLHEHPIGDADAAKGLIFLRKHFKVEDVKVVPKDHYDGPNVNEVLAGCSNCMSSVMRIVEEEIIPVLQSDAGEGIVKIHPELGEVKGMFSLIGEEKAKELGMIVSFFDGAQINHADHPIPYEFMVLQLKVWFELYEHRAQKVNSFAYINQSNNGLQATFSVSEFLIGGRNVVACVTKLKDSRMMAFGLPSHKEQMVPSKGKYLGSVEELGLKGYYDKMKAREGKKVS